MSDLILAIDQGTTSSRAIVFDLKHPQGTKIVAVAQQEFTQHFPNDGWVEHDPEEIWQTTLETAQQAMEEAEAMGGKVVAIGITNQRETSVVWDRSTLKPIYNAIVWQDRRTFEFCEGLKEQGHEALVQEKTGLLLDPYFSASKVSWMLDHVSGAREKALKGELAFGTIDSFIINRLTAGKAHCTDATNASRTSLYNIVEGDWDNSLCEIFNVPKAILPEVLDCAAQFGETDESLFGRKIPILGVAGDQQAAAFGQGCFEPGSVKSTYGTGCFVLMNVGQEIKYSSNRLLSTVAYQLKGQTQFAIEGSIFIAGAVVQWLRDGLKIIESASQTESMTTSLDHNEGVYLVPAFTGMGAPYWRPDARGAIYGITRDTGPNHFARGALESVCYQTFDLVEAMEADGLAPTKIKVDGGMTKNNWLMQFLADTVDTQIDRPTIVETTALGAAYLAALEYGMFDSLEEIQKHWHLDQSFNPLMDPSQRDKNLTGWKQAIRKTLAE